MNARYIKLKFYDNSDLFTTYNDDIVKNQNDSYECTNENIMKNNNTCDDCFCKSSFDNSYFSCNIYNFNLNLFHPLNIRKNRKIQIYENNTNRNPFISSQVINNKYLMNLNKKYNKIKKYIMNYIISTYYIILSFYFNEYNIEEHNLSFYFILHLFQTKFHVFNNNFFLNIENRYESLNENMYSPKHVITKENKSREKNFIYLQECKYKIYTEYELKNNIYLIFEILNNI